MNYPTAENAAVETKKGKNGMNMLFDYNIPCMGMQPQVLWPDGARKQKMLCAPQFFLLYFLYMPISNREERCRMASIIIHEIGNPIVRNYILKTPQGCIAIDTGYPGGCDRFLRRFARIAPLCDLRYVFLTHHHDDHAGFLADLLARCEARVVLHLLALPYLEAGRSREPTGAGYSSRPAALFSLVKKSFTYPPVHLAGRAIPVAGEADQPFEALGLPLRVLPLPGHTADSIGLYLPETGQLFCGDAAMNAVISVAKHTIWIDDAVQYGRTWDKMIALSPARVYPSHGMPFPPAALARHRHYLDGRQLIRPM